MNENQIRAATILAIDDQEDGVALLRQLLQKAGYTHVHTTTDSRKAVAMCAELAPDLLILDLHMPPPSGFDILEHLAAGGLNGTPRLPVLVLTADATPMTRLKALSMGAKDFLTKPIDHVDLLLCVHNLIETRLLGRALDRATRARGADSDRSPATDSGSEILAVLSRVTEYHDPELGARARRVASLAGSIAHKLDTPKEFAEQMEDASQTFDLGMLGVPGSIRAKTGLLTRAEQELWRRHTTAPEAILGDRPGILELARQVACAHHERWDGEGYPKCLRGEEIPLAARVVAVAEGYDNLIQVGSSPEQAAEEILRQAGFAFDPKVAEALAKAVLEESPPAMPAGPMIQRSGH